MSGELSSAELTRYSRHILLPEVALAGQNKLKAASVLVVGAGGLGCPVALYIAAAGVGTIGLVDFDKIDVTNLQRQILFTTSQVGASKVACAADRLRGLNSEITVVEHETHISAADALHIVDGYDIVVDGTDNFSTRYLLNDACILSRKPYVYGSIYRFDGQASVFTHSTGCYRCLFPEPPDAADVPNCAEAGVFGVLPGIIGSIQATEALKLVLGLGESLQGRLLLYDALSMNFEQLKFRRNPQCAVCGDSPTITSIVDESVVCSASDGGLDSGAVDEIGVAQLAVLLKDDSLSQILLDVRSPEEYAICHLDQAVLIPVDKLDARLPELDKSREIITYCKSGMRSRTAAEILRRHGFRARSLSGGILAWAQQQDPRMTTY